MIREIIYWGNKFSAFYNQQDLKVRKKIDYVLWLISYTERVPKKFLKYLEDTTGLYEIKISTIKIFFKEIMNILILKKGAKSNDQNNNI